MAFYARRPGVTQRTRGEVCNAPSSRRAESGFVVANLQGYTKRLTRFSSLLGVRKQLQDLN
jgi:hypothetical protein